jgi:hypothetical protein
LPGWLNARDYLGFETYLVGVDSAGNVVKDWNGLGFGTRFTWKSNTVSTQLQIMSLDDTLPVISGGVFDIESDFVPEPPSAALLIFGFFGIAVCALSRK